MSERTDYAGMAALSICEALLLAMNDHKLLPESEIVGVLRDAAATHENNAGEDGEKETHQAVAGLINLIIDGRQLGPANLIRPDRIDVRAPAPAPRPGAMEH